MLTIFNAISGNNQTWLRQIMLNVTLDDRDAKFYAILVADMEFTGTVYGGQIIEL